MFSRTARYALQVLGFLVNNQGTRYTGEEIAREVGVPANYLSKILNQLRKQGIVDAERGWGGGFLLRKDALQRPIHDIVAIVDGTGGPLGDECVFGMPRCDADNPCPLHDHWTGIKSDIETMLHTTQVRNLGSG